MLVCAQHHHKPCLVAMQTADKGTVCRGLPLPAPRARSRAGQLPLQITLPQLQGSPAVPHCTSSAPCDQRCCFASPLHLKRQNSSSFSLPFFFSPTKTNLPGVHLSLNYFLFLMLKAYAVQLLSCWDANSFSVLVFLRLHSVVATAQMAPRSCVAQNPCL